jgi:glycosyltransferase involved in cell wall biosynthesis
MKILHYISDFSLPSETFIYDLIINLDDDEEISNYVLTHNHILKNERPYVNVKVIKNTFSIKKIYYKLFEPWVVPNKKEVFKYINKLQPDIIHAHFGPNGIKIIKLLKEKKINIPVVLTFHGTDINSMPLLIKSYKDELLIINSYENIQIIAHTSFLKSQIVKQGIKAELIHIIHNGFNPKFSAIKKQKYFKHGDTFKILNVSRLINWKGHIYLIDAFKEFSKIYRNSELTLVGGGDLLTSLKLHTKEIGIDDKINFLDTVNHAEIPEIMSEHDVYIQPSIIDPITFQQEGMPISVLEAIAVGLPVIVTNTGGMPEMILEETEFSFIIEQQSSDEILKLFKNFIGSKYIFQNNNKYALNLIDKYSMSNMIEKVKTLYKKTRRYK